MVNPDIQQEVHNKPDDSEYFAVKASWIGATTSRYASSTSSSGVYSASSSEDSITLDNSSPSLPQQCSNTIEEEMAVHPDTPQKLADTQARSDNQLIPEQGCVPEGRQNLSQVSKLDRP